MVKEKGITQCKLNGQTHAEGFITNWAIRQIHRNLWKTASRMS